jgi:hypothetical protein
MTETKTRDVLVHKANLPLGEKESVGEFMQKLRKSLGGFLLPKLKVSKNGSVWPVEVFSKSVIAEVFVPSQKDDEPSYQLFKCDFVRKGDDFKFAEPREVKRGFIDVESGVEVAKAITEVEKRAELWTGVL